LEPPLHHDTKHRWRDRDLLRSVVDIARVLGWQVFSVSELRGAPHVKAHESVGRHGPVLLLVHSGQQRIVMARLTVSSRRATDGQQSGHAIPGLGHVGSDAGVVARVGESCMWGPRDLTDGSVASFLAPEHQRAQEAA
jgi:hypothetical protein